MRQVAGGLGMGVGKEEEWVRKDKVTYLVNRRRSIDEKKDRISAVKHLNNFNNCRNGVPTKVVN